MRSRSLFSVAAVIALLITALTVESFKEVQAEAVCQQTSHSKNPRIGYSAGNNGASLPRSAGERSGGVPLQTALSHAAVRCAIACGTLSVASFS